MNIYAKKGHKVTVTEQSFKNGNNRDKKRAAAHLKPGNVYTVNRTEVHNFHTNVFIEEIPGIIFNSVQFEDYPLTTPETPKGDSAEAQELKPCPFCGAAEIEQTQKKSMRIRCHACLTGVEQSVLHYPLDWLRAQLIKSWNARIPDVYYHRQQLEKAGNGLQSATLSDIEVVSRAPYKDGYEFSFKRKDGKEIIANWDFIQQVKDHFFSPEFQAIEIYPKQSELVNHANVRHLFVFPAERSMEYSTFVSKMFTREQVVEICREQRDICAEVYEGMGAYDRECGTADNIRYAPLPEKAREPIQKENPADGKD
jgi:hypothetical protein